MYGDLYDEDTDTFYEDDSCYCPHGTYVGTPGGPDLMCGWCEDGVSIEKYRAYQRRVAQQRRNERENLRWFEGFWNTIKLFQSPDDAANKMLWVAANRVVIDRSKAHKA